VDLPFGNAVVFLLYLLPGFLAMQLYRARRPGKRISQFEVIVWSIFHSFIVHLGLAGAAWALGRDDLDLLSRAAESTIQPRTIIILLGGGLVWGGVLTASDWIRTNVPFLPSPDPQAIWPIVAGDAPKKDLWALVRTRQGVLYVGWIKQWSFDPAAEDHDFLLLPAYLVDEKLKVQRHLQKGGVYLNTRDIESFEMLPGT